MTYITAPARVKRLGVGLLAVALAAGAWVAATTGASSPTLQPPSTIDRTGSADVTAPLNAWIAGAPDGATLLFPPSARYRVEGTLLIEAKHHLTLDGQGAQVFATTDGTGGTPVPVWFVERRYPLNRSHVLVYNSSDIAVRRINIKGQAPGGPSSYRPQFEGQSGIKFAACARCLAVSNTVEHVWGDGIEVDFNSFNIVAVGNRVTWNGRQGITLAEVQGATMWANYLGHIGRSYIDIEPGPAPRVADVNIVGNTVEAPGGGIFVAMEGKGSTDRVIIQNNRLLGVPMIVRDEVQPGYPRRQRVVVRNNTTTYGYDNYPAIGMMVFAGIDGVIVTGNTAVARPDEAVRTRDCTNVIVSGNAWQRGARCLTFRPLVDPKGALKTTRVRYPTRRRSPPNKYCAT